MGVQITDVFLYLVLLLEKINFFQFFCNFFVFSYVFLIGDFNFRVDGVSAVQGAELLKQNRMADLLLLDQVSNFEEKIILLTKVFLIFFKVKSRNEVGASFSSF